MSGFFYARASTYLNRLSYLDEISYQFLLIKYLIDRDTALWMHGWISPHLTAVGYIRLGEAACATKTTVLVRQPARA